MSNETDAPKNALGFTVEQYTSEMEGWSPAFRTAIYDQAYESTCSVVFRSGMPTTPAGFLAVTHAIACAAVAGMVLAGYVAVDAKGHVAEDELAKKRNAKEHEQPELPFLANVKGPRVAGAGYL